MYNTWGLSNFTTTAENIMPVEIKLLEQQIKETHDQLKTCDERHREGLLRHLSILQRDLERENFKYGGFMD
jgi:hypothetical protein